MKKREVIVDHRNGFCKLCSDYYPRLLAGVHEREHRVEINDARDRQAENLLYKNIMLPR